VVEETGYSPILPGPTPRRYTPTISRVPNSTKARDSLGNGMVTSHTTDCPLYEPENTNMLGMNY